MFDAFIKGLLNTTMWEILGSLIGFFTIAILFVIFCTYTVLAINKFFSKFL